MIFEQMKSKPYIVAINDIKDICVERTHIIPDNVHVLTMNLRHSGSSIGDVSLSDIARFKMIHSNIVVSESIKSRCSILPTDMRSEVGWMDILASIIKSEYVSFVFFDYTYYPDTHTIWSSNVFVIEATEIRSALLCRHSFVTIKTDIVS